MAQITGIWTRHPRYTFAGGLLSIVLFLFLITSPPHPSSSSLGAYRWQSRPDSDLSSRLALSNSIYNEFLQDRQGLIKKFGPTKEDVALCVVYLGCALLFKSHHANQSITQLLPRCSALARIHSLGLLPSSVQLSTRSSEDRRAG
jgi:hypothetical protein